MKPIYALLLLLLSGAAQIEAQTPPARFWHSMSSNGATTAQTSRVYVLGGTGGVGNSAFFNDLWYYQVATGGWTQVTPVGRSWPKLGRGHSGFSCGAGKCLLFGGTSGTKNLNETWYFTESTATTAKWTQVSCRKPSWCPSARYLPLLAFDPTRGYHVSFGGHSDSATMADTYTFDGASWTLRPSGSPPPARYAGSAAFVPTHNSNGTPVSMDKVVIFGGDPYPNAPYPESLCDMHAWNGSAWEQITASNPGPCLIGAIMAWSTPIGANPHLVVAGGFFDDWTGVPNTDTWYFTFRDRTSGTWTKASLSSCAPLGWARGAYDLPSRKLVFFGGSDDQANAYDDTLVCP